MTFSIIKLRRNAGRQNAASPARGEQQGFLFRRTIGNILHLAGGNGLAALIGMATLAVTAHALGPVALGILALIESYGKFCDQIIRLETWQATIRYGAKLLEDDDPDGFRALIKLCMAVDLFSAFVTGVTAFLIVPLIASWLHWTAEVAFMGKVYSLSLMFGISSAPIGVLRLFDRFAQTAWLEPVLGIVRLVGTFVITLLQGELWAYLILNIAITIVQRLTLVGMALRILRQQGHWAFLRAPLAGTLRHFDGFWRFVMASNGAVLVRKATQEGDILVVGHVAGAHAAGIYQIARKLTLTGIKLGAMLQQVLFPDLARLWSRGKIDEFIAVLRNLELMTLAMGIVIAASVAVFGSTAVRLLAGEGFEDATPLLLLQTLPLLMFLSGSALRPAIMSMGYQVQQFWIVLLSAAVFFVVLFLAVPEFGVVGAPLAHIAFNLTWLPGSMVLFGTALRRERARGSARLAAQPSDRVGRPR